MNLKDISAPRCFELEQRLIEAQDCPVMHDDQHGTAIVVLAALPNAARVTGRPLEGLRVVISGAGAAGVVCTNILLEAGISDVVVLDSHGVLETSRPDLSGVKTDLAVRTNPRGVSGSAADALKGADAFIGVSSGTADEAFLATMAPDAITFALSNPIPKSTPTSQPVALRS